MKNIVFLIPVISWRALSLAAHAASFDCRNATPKVEKLVCSDTAISKLDDELAAACKRALQDETQADSIRWIQESWMTPSNWGASQLLPDDLTTAACRIQ